MPENPAPKKLIIGWFSFTCCEDSTILFTELLNKNFDTWKKLVEFRHVHSLKTNNRLEGLDVAFVEGAITSDKEKKQLLEIRQKAKKLIGAKIGKVIDQETILLNLFF